MLGRIFDRVIGARMDPEVARSGAGEHYKRDLLGKLEQHLKTHDEHGSNVLNINMFRKALHGFCGESFELSAKEREMLENVFGWNGSIRYQDFIEGARELYGSVDYDDTVREIKKLLEQAKSFGINAEERFSQFDLKKAGHISEKRFRQGLKELGIAFNEEQLNRLVTSYQDAKDRSRIMYRMFLEDMSSNVKEWKNNGVTSATGLASDGLDIMDRLRAFARTKLDASQEAYHHFWMEFEHQDKMLDGCVTLDGMVQALKNIGFELSHLDKRRLQNRFPGHGDAHVRYRDMLSAILNNSEEAQSPTNGTKSNGNEAFDAIAESEHEYLKTVRSKGPFGVSALEQVTRGELDDILRRLRALSKEKPYNEAIDLRDIFEQFDYDLTGWIARDDFVRVMSWMGFLSVGNNNKMSEEDLKGSNLVTRLANYLELGSSKTVYPDCVCYRKLFILLEEHGRNEIRRQDSDWQKSEVVLETLLQQVKERVKNLALSGIDFTECFKDVDEEQTGLITHRQFHQALSLLGVSTPMVTLTMALKRFEVEPELPEEGMSDEVKQQILSQEHLVCYKDFIEMIQNSLEAEEDEREDRKLSNKLEDSDDEEDDVTDDDFYFDDSVLAGSSNKQRKKIRDGIKLHDRFEIISAFRKIVYETIMKQQKNGGDRERILRECFEDLDLCGDGAIQLNDLMEGARLLGIRASEYELKRVADFPFLFREPNLTKNGSHVFLPPRSPWDLADESIRWHKDRAYELSFVAFKEILGIQGGEEDDGENGSRRQYRVENGQPVASTTFHDLLNGKEETHVSKVELIEGLRNLLKKKNHGSDLYYDFEAHDTDMSNLIDELEAREAFAKTLNLHLTEEEGHRLFRRLEVLEQPALRLSGDATKELFENQTKKRSLFGKSDSTTEEVSNTAGTCRVRYRKLLKDVLGDEDFLHESKLTLSWQEELHLEHFRSHEDISKLVKAMKQPPRMKSRKEMWKVLMKFHDTGDTESQRTVRLILRRFEGEDELIDAEKFLELIHLDIPVRKELSLRRMLSASSKEVQALLSKFESKDETFSGSLPKKLFENCFAEANKHLQLTHHEMEKLCSRFNINPFSNKKEKHGMIVDYRAMIRHFTAQVDDLLPRLNGDSTSTNTGKRGQQNPRDFDLVVAGKWGGKAGKLWKFIWEYSEASMQENASSSKGVKKKSSIEVSLMDSMKKKALSYFAWKVRKDLYEYAHKILDKLNPKLCTVEKHWKEVALALVAISFLIKVLCPKAPIPTLESGFIEWSKKNGKVFFKMMEKEGVRMEVGFTYGENEEFNKEFVANCKIQWRQAELEIKQQLLVNQMDARKSLSSPRDVQLDAPETDEIVKPQGKKLTITAQCKAWLMEMGMKALEHLFELGKKEKEKDVQKEKQEAQLEAKAHHEHFIRKKNELKLKVPKHVSAKSVLDPILQALLRRANGGNTCYASNHMDLEKGRKALLQHGIVLKENFRNEDGDIKHEDYERMQQIVVENKIQSIPIRLQGADHQFELWCERKQARQFVDKVIHFIETPAVRDGTYEEREIYWKDVGRALKGIDSYSLQPVFLKWSKGFAPRSKCIATWNEFPPKKLSMAPASSSLSSNNKDEQDAWVWVHLRGILIKILSKKDVNFALAFQAMANDYISAKAKESNPTETTGKRKTKRLTYEQLLRCTMASEFRTVLSNAGVNLRLHEEKRLFEYFPGHDDKGSVVANSINMASFLKITGTETNWRKNKEILSLGWNNQHVGTLASGAQYELSLDEKVQLALHEAGAPEEICMDWRKQRASLQRGLIFLSVVSRENRLLQKQVRKEQATAKPPSRPYFEAISGESTQVSVTLSYGTKDEKDNVLFYSIEQVNPSHSTESNGFETIFHDPPTMTTPPSHPSGKHIVSGLRPDTKYEFRVIAFNQHGPSEAVRGIFATLPKKPLEPKVCNVTCEGKNARCTLIWGHSLEVESHKDKTFKNAPIAVVPENFHFGTSTVLSTGNHMPLWEKETSSGGNGRRFRDTFYQLYVVDEKLFQNDEQRESGICVFRGQSTVCDIVGLKPGERYQFFVRALNCFGEPGEASAACQVIPLQAPVKPKVVIRDGETENVVVKWRPYDTSQQHNDEKSDAALKGVLANWAETIRRWETNGTETFYSTYTLKLTHKRNKSKPIFINTTKLKTTLSKLGANREYEVRLRLTLSQTGGYEDIKSPWSAPSTFHTAPEPPTQPILVHASHTTLVLRWYEPLGGAKYYQIETESWDIDKPDESSDNTGVIQYKGRTPFVVLSGLKPNTLYRIRAFAMADKEGKIKSRSSLPAQFQTLTADAHQESLSVPSRAGVDFTIPCAGKDLVLGDLILFTENRSIPCWRTIAGRVVVVKEAENPSQTQFWLQIEWCTVSSKSEKDKLVFPNGARIQRKQCEIFQYETEFGVYRTPWAEEPCRWSRKQEHDASLN